MTSKKITLALLSFTTLTLAACHVPPMLEDAQYWQRKNATSAIYLRGPKAQQTLHMDIATCANEISELERLGALREAIPADTRDGKVPDPASAPGKLAKWDTPKKDGYLYSEHLPYTDFETCMDAKGWERVESLPYDRATTAREDYLENVYGYKYQTNTPQQNVQNSADAYASSPGTTINQ